MIQAHSHFVTQFSWLDLGWGGGGELFVLLWFFFPLWFPFSIPVSFPSCTERSYPLWCRRWPPCLAAACPVRRLPGLGHHFPAMGTRRSHFAISGICLCSGTESLLWSDAISQQSMNRAPPGRFYTFLPHQTGDAAAEPLLHGPQAFGHPFTLAISKFSLPCMPTLGRSYWYFGQTFSPEHPSAWLPL